MGLTVKNPVCIRIMVKTATKSVNVYNSTVICQLDVYVSFIHLKIVLLNVTIYKTVSFEKKDSSSIKINVYYGF